MAKISPKAAYDFGRAFGKLEEHLNAQDEHLEGIEDHLKTLNGRVAEQEKWKIEVQNKEIFGAGKKAGIKDIIKDSSSVIGIIFTVIFVVAALFQIFHW